VLLAALLALSIWRIAPVPSPSQLPVDVVSRRLQETHADLERAAARIPTDADVRLVDEIPTAGNRRAQRAIILGYVMMPRRMVRDDPAADHVVVVVPGVRGQAPADVESQLAAFPPSEWERLGIYAGEFALLRRVR
jgi:hypothetical protein